MADEFYKGARVGCVNAEGSKTLEEGSKYVVAQVLGKGLVRLEEKGTIAYDVQRFELFADQDKEVKGHLVVSVVFNSERGAFGGHRNKYAYYADDNKVEVGSYVVVPDVITSWDYVVAKVVEMAVEENRRDLKSIVSAVDDSEYKAAEKRRKELAQKRQKLSELEKKARKRADQIQRERSLSDLLANDEVGKALLAELQELQKDVGDA